MKVLYETIQLAMDNLGIDCCEGNDIVTYSKGSKVVEVEYDAGDQFVTCYGCGMDTPEHYEGHGRGWENVGEGFWDAYIVYTYAIPLLEPNEHWLKMIREQVTNEIVRRADRSWI